MRHHYISLAFAFLFLLGCSATQQIDKELTDEYYQPLGTAVLAANGFLIADYPDGLPGPVDIDAYKKSLLDEGYNDLYEKISPMTVVITPVDNCFTVEIQESGKRILYDISCTESRIDCWTYRGQCDPDTVGVRCE